MKICNKTFEAKIAIFKFVKCMKIKSVICSLLGNYKISQRLPAVVEPGTVQVLLAVIEPGMPAAAEQV